MDDIEHDIDQIPPIRRRWGASRSDIFCVGIAIGFALAYFLHVFFLRGA
jgi:hypothetical protein